MAAQKSDTPASVALNLDTLEREASDQPAFVVTVGGKRVEFNDPQELDWQALALAQSNPAGFLREAIPDAKQQALFFSQKIPVWKLNRLILSYYNHYGVDPEAPAAS